MSRLEIGDVEITAEDGRLTFTRKGESVARIRLDGDGLAELLDFLRSVRIDEQNRRRGFRVPNQANRLRTRLGGRFESVVTRARDVSLSGIFLEFPEGRPQLDLHDELEISLAHGRETAELTGTVSRQAEDGVGVVFAHAADMRAPTPPPEFAKIVMALEREWLASRLRA